MREAKQIYAAVEETVEKLGPNLFVSVANAGVTQVKPLLECTPEYVSAMLRIPCPRLIAMPGSSRTRSALTFSDS